MLFAQAAQLIPRSFRLVVFIGFEDKKNWEGDWILLRTGALGLAVVVAAPISSLVTACSPNVQNSSLPENPASSIASAVTAQTMNHGTMQHGGMGHSIDIV
jgi:hypothetical protein